MKEQIEEIRAILLEDCGNNCSNCEFYSMKPLSCKPTLQRRLPQAERGGVDKRPRKQVRTSVSLLGLQLLSHWRTHKAL